MPLIRTAIVRHIVRARHSCVRPRVRAKPAMPATFSLHASGSHPIRRLLYRLPQPHASQRHAPSNTMAALQRLAEQQQGVSVTNTGRKFMKRLARRGALRRTPVIHGDGARIDTASAAYSTGDSFSKVIGDEGASRYHGKGGMTANPACTASDCQMGSGRPGVSAARRTWHAQSSPRASRHPPCESRFGASSRDHHGRSAQPAR